MRQACRGPCGAPHPHQPETDKSGTGRNSWGLMIMILIKLISQPYRGGPGQALARFSQPRVVFSASPWFLFTRSAICHSSQQLQLFIELHASCNQRLTLMLLVSPKCVISASLGSASLSIKLLVAPNNARATLALQA